MEPPQIIHPTQTPAPAPAPPPANTGGNDANYDFILNPQKPTNKSPGVGVGPLKDPFIAKIVFVVGGALVVMLVAWFAVTLLFSNKASIETLVALTQREQEIVRVSALGDDSSNQQIKNAAMNTQLSIKSHQNKLLAYLKAHKRQVKSEELSLKKDATTDPKLKKAKETGTFDTTYASIMRAQLSSYASALKSAYNNESSKTGRTLLSQQYNDVQLLLKSWPESTTQ